MVPWSISLLLKCSYSLFSCTSYWSCYFAQLPVNISMTSVYSGQAELAFLHVAISAVKTASNFLELVLRPGCLIHFILPLSKASPIILLPLADFVFLGQCSTTLTEQPLQKTSALACSVLLHATRRRKFAPLFQQHSRTGNRDYWEAH